MSERGTVKGYLRALKKELKGQDPSLVVDAMDDAEEFLEESIHDILREGDVDDRKTAMKRAIRMLGTPRTFAREYMRSEEEGSSKKRKTERRSGSLTGDIFGVALSGKTYLNYIYLLLLFPVGLIYFVYILTVATLGIGLLITITGIPLIVLFLVSIYGMSWAHGRLTELMLGIRMPSKRRKLRLTGSAWRRLITILKDPSLYTSLLYMVMLMPIGVLTFSVFFSLGVVSLAMIISPVTSIIAVTTNTPMGYPGPDWFNIFSSFIGFLFGWALLFWTLHLSNITATGIGKLSRAVLLKR